MASPSADEEANVPLGCGECILPSDFIGYFPYAKPWCWNMNPNICPCPKSPSHFLANRPWHTASPSEVPQVPCPLTMLHTGIPDFQDFPFSILRSSIIPQDLHRIPQDFPSDLPFSPHFPQDFPIDFTIAGAERLTAGTSQTYGRLRWSPTGVVGAS